MRDSLSTLSRAYVDVSYRFPATIDSVYPPYKLHPYHLHAADAAGLSDALRFAPQGVTIPYSLSSSLNRFLYLGLPTPRPFLWTDGPLRMPAPGPCRGTDYLFAGDIRSVSLHPAHGLQLTRTPMPTVIPVAFLYWENGAFDENTVRAFIARPISRNLSVGIASNRRTFRGMAFDHRSGGVYSTFRGAVSDTSRIVDEGTNPVTDEHTVVITGQWRGKTDAHVRYSYLDLRNGHAYGPDSTSHRFDTVYQYEHDISVGLDTLMLGPVRTSAELVLNQGIQREIRALDVYGAYLWKQRGEQKTAAADLYAALDGAANTIAVRAESRVMRKEFYREFYRSRSWNLSHTRVTGSYDHRLDLGPIGLDMHAAGGHCFETAADRSGNAWIWNAAAVASLGGQELSVFGRRDVLPYTPPYDDDFVVEARLPDVTTMYGTSLSLQTRRLGFTATYVYSDGVDSSSLAHAWPDGQYPYAEPHSVLVLNPRVGRLFGFGLFARYLLSDARPYHKMQAGLSYELNTAHGNEHIRAEVAVDYWSERDPVLYQNISTWNRPVVDLYAKGSIQIQSFRLFYKVDNILNRKFAYVPGYFMPGITFRWGLNWYFQR